MLTYAPQECVSWLVGSQAIECHEASSALRVVAGVCKKICEMGLKQQAATQAGNGEREHGGDKARYSKPTFKNP